MKRMGWPSFRVEPWIRRREWVGHPSVLNLGSGEENGLTILEGWTLDPAKRMGWPSFKVEPWIRRRELVDHPWELNLGSGEEKGFPILQSWNLDLGKWKGSPYLIFELLRRLCLPPRRFLLISTHAGLVKKVLVVHSWNNSSIMAWSYFHYSWRISNFGSRRVVILYF